MAIVPYTQNNAMVPYQQYQPQSIEPSSNFLPIERERVDPPMGSHNLFTYPSSGLIGGAVGALGGGLLSKVFRGSIRNGVLAGGLGGATGALVRRYDMANDPPGLSSVYSIPAGAKLGLLAGGAMGLANGLVRKKSILPSVLLGMAGGGLGGAIISPVHP